MRSPQLNTSTHGSTLPKLTSQGNLVAGAVTRVSVGFMLNPFSVLKARYEVRVFRIVVGIYCMFFAKPSMTVYRAICTRTTVCSVHYGR